MSGIEEAYAQTQTEQRNAFLTQLIDESHVEHPTAVGIIKQVIASGESSLTQAQTTVYEQQVVEKFIEVDCKRCHETIPNWSERTEALDNEGYCSWCVKMLDNDD